MATGAERRALYQHTVRLARPTAEAGNADAMWLIARRLNHARHTEEAESWLWRSAQNGNIHACSALDMLLWASGRIS
jgi:TPR repeat protein